MPDVQASAETEAEASVTTATVEIERVVEAWPAVVGHCGSRAPRCSRRLFDEARPIAIEEDRDVLRVGFPESAKFQKKKAESSANIERMTDAITAIVGQRLRPAYELHR